MDQKPCPSVTSRYSDEAIDAASLADIPNETHHHGVAGVAHLGDSWLDNLGTSPTLDGASTAYLLSSFPEDFQAGPYSNEVAEAPVATIPAFTPRILSLHRPKLVKPNIFIRDAQTGEALYFAEMTSLNVSAGLILHNGIYNTGSVAARLTLGLGLEAYPASTDRKHNPASDLRLYLTDTVFADTNGTPMQRKLICQSIQWKEGKVGKPWTLVNDGTEDILAVYTKAKNKPDGRKGYLRIQHKDLVGRAEALTVLTLCALLEEKRQRRRRRSAGWKRGGAIASILVGSVVIFGPIFGPIIGVPLVFAGNFHHIDKYERD